MTDTIDKLVPLVIVLVFAVVTGWLISLVTGHLAITIAVCSLFAMFLLLVVGAFLPPETEDE